MKNSDTVFRVACRVSLSRAGVNEAESAVLRLSRTLTREGIGRRHGTRPFSTKSLPARGGRHPWTSESIAIPASRAPAFKAGKTLRHAVG